MLISRTRRSATFHYAIVALLVFIIYITFRHQLNNALQVLEERWFEPLEVAEKFSDETLSDCIDLGDSLGHEDLIALRKHGYSCGLQSLDLDSFTDDQLVLTLNTYLDNLDEICYRKLHLGALAIAGETCDDPDVRLKPPCIVYVFKVVTELSFANDMVHLYGCQVYYFDPRLNLSTFNNSEKLDAFNIALSGKTGFTNVNHPKWNMSTLEDLSLWVGKKDANIDLINMDMEGLEWNALDDMISSGRIKHVRQLLIAFYVNENPRRMFYLTKLKILQKLADIGYKKFDVHKSNRFPVAVKGFPSIRTRKFVVSYLLRH